MSHRHRPRGVASSFATVRGRDISLSLSLLINAIISNLSYLLCARARNALTYIRGNDATDINNPAGSSRITFQNRSPLRLHKRVGHVRAFLRMWFFLFFFYEYRTSISNRLSVVFGVVFDVFLNIQYFRDFNYGIEIPFVLNVSLY